MGYDFLARVTKRFSQSLFRGKERLLTIEIEVGNKGGIYFSLTQGPSMNARKRLESKRTLHKHRNRKGSTVEVFSSSTKQWLKAKVVHRASFVFSTIFFDKKWVWKL